MGRQVEQEKRRQKQKKKKGWLSSSRTLCMQESADKAFAVSLLPKTDFVIPDPGKHVSLVGQSGDGLDGCLCVDETSFNLEQASCPLTVSTPMG